MINHQLTEYLLLDGQQRLTTIMLILRALYDLCETKEVKDELMRYLEVRYIDVENDKKDNIIITKRFRLALIGEDNEIFKSILFPDVTMKAILNSVMKNNYSHIRGMINKSGYKIIEYLQAIKSLYIIELNKINYSFSENSQEVFESINSTGLPLSQADLLKNYIMMNVPTKDQESLYKTYWRQLEAILKHRIDEVLCSYFEVKVRKILKAEDYYKESKKYINRIPDKDMTVILKDILIFSDAYTYASGMSIHDNKAIRTRLKELSLMKAEYFTPAIAYILYLHTKHPKIIDSYIAVDLLDACIAYIYRRSITCKSIDETKLCLLDMLKLFDEIETGVNYFGRVKLYLRDQAKYICPSNEEVIDYIVNNDIPKSVKIYTLLKLAGAIYKNLTVEHIMPQSLTPEWRKELGANHSQIHKKMLNKLGNLTLESSHDNSDLANRPFSEKKKYFKNSEVSISKDIASYQKWDEKAINDRSLKLAKEIIRQLVV